MDECDVNTMDMICVINVPETLILRGLVTSPEYRSLFIHDWITVNTMYVSYVA